jgi:vitamin B12 transporter
VVYRRFGATLGACLFSIGTVSISNVVVADESVATGQQIVVTATRTSETADETLAAVSVITRSQIEQSQAQTIEDLLRGEAGLDVVRSGGPLQQTSVFMRGTNSDHVLVMIDGVRANSATTGAFAWERLNLDQIERIEIVRGSRSSVYGSDAIGGVIQIFTRRSDKTSVRAEAGSFGTNGLSATTRLGSTEKWLSLSASNRRADGFSATNANNYSFNPDNDGYEQRALSLTSGLTLSPGTRVSVSAMQTDANSQYDNGTASSTNRSASAKIEFGRDRQWQQSLAIGHYYDRYVTGSTVNTTRNQLDWQNEFALDSQQRLVAGMSYEAVQSSNSGAPYTGDLNNKAAYAAWHTQRGAHSFELGGRYDVHGTFGSHPTGQLAWGYRVDPAWRVRSAVGTAFKAPDQNELYHPGYSGSYAGNPALQPETSRGYEVGVTHERNNSRTQLTAYLNDIANLIASQGTNYQSINIGRASTYGVEMEYERRWNKWSLDATATLQRTRDESNGAELLRRPGSKYTLRLRRELANGSMHGELIGVGDYRDYAPSTIGTVPGHVVVNAGWQRRLASDWQVDLRLDNLTDQRYDMPYGYNGSPRAAYVGLRWSATRGAGAP